MDSKLITEKELLFSSFSWFSLFPSNQTSFYLSFAQAASSSTASVVLFLVVRSHSDVMTLPTSELTQTSD